MQAKKYLCVRQKGIVRLTTETPAHIEGVFFEHLITCVGLCFRSPDNKRMSFIHMDRGIDLQSIKDEVAWIDHPEWELVSFINNQANTETLARNHLPPETQTEYILSKYLKEQQWTVKGKSHWKSRIDTKTSIAFIDRNFKWVTQHFKADCAQYFGNDKLVEAIDLLNNCFESICKNGLLKNQRSPLRIDYDGCATLSAEPVLVVPPLLRRPLQLVAAIITSLPEDAIEKFRNIKENPQCFNIIATLIPKLLIQLFNPDEMQPVLMAGPRFAPDIALVLQEYVNNPQGGCANLINDHLRNARAEPNECQNTLKK